MGQAGNKQVARVASAVRENTGIRGAFSPLFMVRAAGLEPCPEGGARGTVYCMGGALYYDESVSGWQDRAARLACGKLLRMHDASDDEHACAELAAALQGGSVTLRLVLPANDQAMQLTA